MQLAIIGAHHYGVMELFTDVSIVGIVYLTRRALSLLIYHLRYF